MSASLQVTMVPKSFGFGSVAKLMTLATMLPDTAEVTYVADEPAFGFAAGNGDAGSRYVRVDDAEDFDALAGPLRDADVAVVVRNPAAVWVAAIVGTPVVFSDSLFAFWRPDQPVARLAQLAAEVPVLSLEDAARRYRRLGSHDRVMTAHLMGDRSLVQRVPGVDDRLAALRRAGIGAGIEVCGPITMAPPASPIAAGSALAGIDLSASVVINLGGAFTGFDEGVRRGSYVDVVLRWASTLRAEAGGAVLLASGAPPTVRDGVTVVRLCHEDMLRAALGAGRYVCAPGLTAVLEAVTAGRVPEMLFEAHYGHVFNLDSFAGTPVGDTCARLHNIVDGFAPPLDDEAGSRYIAERLAEIAASPKLCDRVRDVMAESHARHGSALARQGSQALERLRRMIGGPHPAGRLRAALTHLGVMETATPPVGAIAVPAARVEKQ